VWPSIPNSGISSTTRGPPNERAATRMREDTAASRLALPHHTKLKMSTHACQRWPTTRRWYVRTTLRHFVGTRAMAPARPTPYFVVRAGRTLILRRCTSMAPLYSSLVSPSSEKTTPVPFSNCASCMLRVRRRETGEGWGNHRLPHKQGCLHARKLPDKRRLLGLLHLGSAILYHCLSPPLPSSPIPPPRLPSCVLVALYLCASLFFSPFSPLSASSPSNFGRATMFPRTCGA